MADARQPESYEEHEEALDPHRREERLRVRQETIAHLESHGVRVTGAESDSEIGDLEDAVERFEHEVETHGGDLFVDSGAAREPDDPVFVLPKRHGHEPVAEYLGRIDEATMRVQRRGREGGGRADTHR
ncbi:MAG TPA: hypothetical protein VJO52_15035 [Gemmatimonadaceae bacterium]|nr:hypothetical protein [Gemmatimonadaceae bacterium]